MQDRLEKVTQVVAAERVVDDLIADIETTSSIGELATQLKEKISFERQVRLQLRTYDLAHDRRRYTSVFSDDDLGFNSPYMVAEFRVLGEGAIPTT
jgi:hypothetical protein